jgi:glutamine amidotransferase
MSVAIVRYNAGNVRSVSIALNRLGVEHEITDDPARLRDASHVILPGVGEASSAMRYLAQRGLTDLLADLTQPVLGVCLGLQVLCSYSEENDTPCIGVFPERVRLFRIADKVPHIGWNRVRPHSGGDWPFDEDYYYFVHSYYAEVGPSTVAVSDYGETFSAVLRKGNFLATQFHPEKSADAGYGILTYFLNL